jgi:hypothetical protein
MGGKGRGVFSDFRLGRVCGPDTNREELHTNYALVPIPSQRARWKPAGCEEGQLVEREHWIGGCGLSVYYIETAYHIGRRSSLECNTIQQLLAASVVEVVTDCSFSVFAALTASSNAAADSTNKLIPELLRPTYLHR